MAEILRTTLAEVALFGEDATEAAAEIRKFIDSKVLDGSLREFYPPPPAETVRFPEDINFIDFPLHELTADARMLEIPGGESVPQQIRNGLMPTAFKWQDERDRYGRLHLFRTRPIETIYLPGGIIEGSTEVTYRDEDHPTYYQRYLDTLPQPEGVTWVLPRAAELNRILAFHFETQGERLLPGVAALTEDTFDDRNWGMSRVTLGHFDQNGTKLGNTPGHWTYRSPIGVFALGIPSQVSQPTPPTPASGQ